MTSSALALATPSNTGDTQLCYVCHGFEALGSGTDVQSSFSATSAHSLAPSSTVYGPSVKYCSSCHDSHGTDEITSGTPYPKLLRSRTSTGTQFFQAEEYCATCHLNRPLDTFDGLTIYRQTGHYSKLPDPANGTKIRCSICHVAHGSAIAPLLVSEIASPALVATFTVPANDRRLCLGCHPTSFGTFPGSVAYALSGHAVSSALTTETGEWPAADAKRLVGECQVCHAPMGRDNGSGTAIPKLVDATGRALCDRCHDADGPASTDTSSLAYPAAAATDLELLVAISPTATTAAQGRLAVYGTEATSTAPRALVGPREYRAAGPVGDMAVGDIDGDGDIETLVTQTNATQLTVFRSDALKGLTTFGTGAGAMTIAASAEYIAIADVLGDFNALPEILALDADADNLYVYRWDATLHVPVLVGGMTNPIPVGGAGRPTGIATGGLVGTAFADAVVTSDAGQYELLSEGSPGVFSVVQTVTTLAGPRGPSIGNVWDAAGVEIAIANSGETSDTVSVFAADGTLLGHVKVDAETGAQAWDTLIADVLPTSAGAELSVAVYGADGTSTVNVFPQATGGLDTPQPYDTGKGYGTGSLASGDIDGDSQTELIAGNGGWWDRDATKDMAPSVQVFDHLFSTLSMGAPLWSGGVELAGTAPALAVADVGGVGPSRHPVGAVAGAHNSTETPAFARHVECVDCHDPHEATSTVGVAPLAYGRIKGVFGVAITNTGAGTAITYGDAQPVVREYELCLKCHSGYSNLEGGRNIASEVNTRNVSVHGVEEAYTAAANASTFETGWSNDSVLYCVDCHDSANSAVGAVRGPHVSTAAPILARPYLGVLPGDTNLLCYDCHKRTVYFTGTADTGTESLFYAGATNKALHSLHVSDHGFGCATCHESHGSPTEDRIMRADVGYSLNAGGGTCDNSCHPSPTTSTYAR